MAVPDFIFGLKYSCCNRNSFLLDRVIPKISLKGSSHAFCFVVQKSPLSPGHRGRQVSRHTSLHNITDLLSSVLREGLQVVKEEEACGKPLCSYRGAPLFESCSGCLQGALAPIRKQLSNSLAGYAFTLP